MTYHQVIKYLESFINYEKIPSFPYKESLKLDRIKEFLAYLNNPQDSLKCIHVAGTKGKGSTCALLTYILREAGYKVGLYTSPHLSDFRERIRILSHRVTPSTSLASVPSAHRNTSARGGAGKSPSQRLNQDFEGIISNKELIDLVERLKPVIEKYNKNSKYGPLSFFEVYTASAFTYFKEKKVDFAVLETGLGGRLDATNTVNPLICCITPISYEHTQKLGNTLREIATEKVGIIKSQKLTVISAPQEKEAREVIRNRAEEVGAKLYEVNKDLFYEKTNPGFNVMGIFAEYPNLEIKLLGRHQLINATVAIGAIEALRFFDIYVDIDSIRKGLYNTVWPGRCEVIAKNPLIILDGAQNVASCQALKETIKENFSAEGGSATFCGGKYKNLILVLGISNDKDIKGICQELYALADKVILTQASNPRATEPRDLATYFKDKEVYITNNVKEAIKKAKDLAEKKDLILVTGSLFVVGEFRDGKI